MAEIGIIASIIGVAGAGFRLSLILNAVGSEVASAGVEIHSISKSVTLFSLMLKQVGQHLQTADSVHSEEALDTAKHITEECQIVFDQISDMLDKVQTRRDDGSHSPTLQQRFKWCFKKHRVTYLLAQLESLKLSLLLMLGILQMGKIMAMPPKSNAKEEAVMRNDIILQERAEVQNIVIVRYWALSRLERLFLAAEQEDKEDRRAEAEQKSQTLIANGQPQLMIEESPAESSETTLTRLQVVSLGELDQALNRIRESPRDMIRVSDSVIDPLLDRWTRWHEIREYLERRPGSAGRYAPTVDDLYESDEDHHRHHHYNRDFSHEQGYADVAGRGYYLEGTTTDWRHPHSVEAKREAARLRKRYSGFQPSVDEEDEGHRETRGFKAKPPTRHVIDSSSSSSSSSDSEYEKPRRISRRRRSSASTSETKHVPSTNGRPQRPKDGSNLARFATTPNPIGLTPNSTLSGQHSTHAHRPPAIHATTAPLPPLHTGNVPNPYQGHAGIVPLPLTPPGSYVPPTSAQRYVPAQAQTQRLTPPRPSSSDGKHRSPSRAASVHSITSQIDDDDRKQQKSRHHKNLRKGATRGLLGAGALAGFLEALEGLSL